MIESKSISIFLQRKLFEKKDIYFSLFIYLEESRILVCCIWLIENKRKITYWQESYPPKNKHLPI